MSIFRQHIQEISKCCSSGNAYEISTHSQHKFMPIFFSIRNTPYSRETITDPVYHQKGYKSLVSQFT